MEGFWFGTIDDALSCQGRIQDFSNAGGWYLGVAESMRRAPKMSQFQNLIQIQDCYIRNTTNALN